VICEPTSLRLPPAKWAGFWSTFAHVVRNTVDHGVETSAQREASGKSPHATVKLSVVRDGVGVVVSISDDGPGVDWQAIATRARERGMPHASRAELEAALFCDGISSRRESTAISGRGVGLGAVREVVRALGGRSYIEDAKGGGTVFRFHLPESMLANDAGAVPTEDRRVVVGSAGSRTGARSAGSA